MVVLEDIYDAPPCIKVLISIFTLPVYNLETVSVNNPAIYYCHSQQPFKKYNCESPEIECFFTVFTVKNNYLGQE